MPIRTQIPRIDALEKVLGKALYAADIELEGMLYGAIVRSTRPHAKIKKIDPSKALSIPGIIKVLTAKDIPGENSYGVIRKDQPLLAADKVRFIGEAIAIVVAESEEVARKAASLVEITYEDLPCVSGPDQARKNVVLVHDDGNVLCQKYVVKGNIEEGFANSDVVIERTYRTTWLDHAFLEVEAGVGYLDEQGRITVISSTQNVHYKRRELSRILKLPEDRIRVVQATTGGGFGGKLDVTVEGYVALCVFHIGRPVMIRYTREESFLVNTKRHPLWIRYKTGASKYGKLKAVEVEIVGDTGAYASYGETVALRSAIHATGPYEVPNVYVRSTMYYTNNPVSGAMRGFGVPQIAFAHESQMDILAKELGLDPIDLRLMNALRSGSLTATGQVLGKSVGFLETLKAIEAFWRERKKREGTGFGLGSMFYGIGNTGVPNPSRISLSLNEDGRIVIFSGVCDIGQGSNTAIIQIVCETLGISPDRVVLIRADTDATEDAGSTSASRQTYISGRAAQIAALKMREFLEKEGFYKGRSLADIYQSHKTHGPLRFQGFFDPPTTSLDPSTGQGVPYATYAFATQMAEVRVDSRTGTVEIIRVIAAHDVGKVINREGVRGQILGGIAMGIGFALMEEFIPGQTRSLDSYYIPTSVDMPREVELFLIESEEPTGPFGAKGVGEPALIPTAAAIVNAIADAIGERIYQLPASIERVYELCKKQKKAGGL